MGTYAQSPDSLYCAPIQKIRILVNKAQLLVYANQAVDSLEATVKTGIKLQAHTDSLLNVRTQMLSLVRLDMRDSVALQKVYLSEEKRKRKRNGWARNIFMVTTGVLLYLLIKP